jgi:hypothetical protein
LRVVDYILTLLGWAHGARDGTHLQLLVFFRGDHLDPTGPSAGGRVARAAAARGRAREHRASLLRNARGENAHPARGISSFWQTAARATGETSDDRIVFQRNGRLTVPFNFGTCRLQLRFAFFSHRGRFAKSPQNPVDRARTVDFPGCHPAEGVVAFPTPRTSSPLARARTRRAPPPSHRASDDDGQGAEEDAGGARG